MKHYWAISVWHNSSPKWNNCKQFKTSLEIQLIIYIIALLLYTFTCIIVSLVAPKPSHVYSYLVTPASVDIRVGYSRDMLKIVAIILLYTTNLNRCSTKLKKLSYT